MATSLPSCVSATVSRRALLRGAGAAVALPWLESLAKALGAPDKPPTRFALLFMSNGVLASSWDPAGPGPNYELSPTLRPLDKLKSEFSVLTGLRNKNSLGGDGHYAKDAALMTGSVVKRTGGRDLENGISFDQHLAATAGRATPLPSIELGTEPVWVMEDMGYSTVYGAHISWRSATQPVAKEIVPRLAFDRLFRTFRGRREGADAGVLDAVLADARRLRGAVGSQDRRKLEEYYDSVRALELRIERCGQLSPEAQESVGRSARPTEGVPKDFAEHCRLMLEILALAFETDSTRVASFMFGNSVSGRDFSFLPGVQGGHHELSHHENKEEKKQQYQKIQQWHVEQLAAFLERLRSVREGEGTLLDHSAVVFASGMRDGNAHDPNDLPVLLCGRAGGAHAPGKLLRYPNPTPLCNLYVSLAEWMGAPVPSFGDGTEKLI